jgi:3',5'-nucleoside bisphosphate phosphatase
MADFDLHFHSTYSDGIVSVPELAAIVKQKKLKYCALADHDTVDGVNELMKCLDGSGIKVIPATELTAQYQDTMVHILAYDFDIDAVVEIVGERNEIVRRKKVEEMEIAIKLFRSEGLGVTHGLLPSAKQPVGLTIALDICANSSNQDFFLKKHGKQFMPEDVYYEYQAPGKSCAVERSGVTVEWIVKKCKGAVRDLIIAHPFVPVSIITKPLDEAGINDLLRLGITGIEVYHDKTSDEQILLLQEIVNERRIHYTGGSDSHGKKNDAPIGQYGLHSVIPGFNLSNYNSSHLRK